MRGYVPFLHITTLDAAYKNGGIINKISSGPNLLTGWFDGASLRPALISSTSFCDWAPDFSECAFRISEKTTLPSFIILLRCPVLKNEVTEC